MRPAACAGRRETLRRLGLAAGALLATGSPFLAGCGAGPGTGAGGLRLPLADLEAGGRKRIVHREVPIELSRDGSGEVTARSLLCSHMGCEVRWSESARRYLCPCHGGAFDAAGKPVAGPPNRPLAVVPVRIADGAIWIEG